MVKVLSLLIFFQLFGSVYAEPKNEKKSEEESFSLYERAKNLYQAYRQNSKQDTESQTENFTRSIQYYYLSEKKQNLKHLEFLNQAAENSEFHRVGDQLLSKKNYLKYYLLAAFIFTVLIFALEFFLNPQIGFLKKILRVFFMTTLWTIGEVAIFYFFFQGPILALWPSIRTIYFS